MVVDNIAGDIIVRQQDHHAVTSAPFKPTFSSSGLFVLDQRREAGRLGGLQHVGKLVSTNVGSSGCGHREFGKFIALVWLDVLVTLQINGRAI